MAKQTCPNCKAKAKHQTEVRPVPGDPNRVEYRCGKCGHKYEALKD